MKLSDLLSYSNIYIQCHNNPDADAIASAYGLYCYYKSNGINTHIIYGGVNEITKANLLLMIRELDIPIDYIPADMTEVNGLLITVDCQYGQGNVFTLKASDYACIDHHNLYTDLPKKEVRPFLGGCSTLVWDMMRAENYFFENNRKLTTALYYGLMTDTGNFIENLHPLDRDMKDTLVFDKNLITRFINSNISIKELEIAGIALIRHIYNDDHRFAVVHSAPCDPNILGLISDLVLTVDKIDTCVVYNDADNGFKISVRSCIKEVRANELAAYLTENIGSGGGHDDKAGGFILESAYENLYPTINTETYFGLRMTKYFDECEIIYADRYLLDTEDMPKYLKQSRPLGYVDLSELLPNGTPITIRTLLEDSDAIVDENVYTFLGVQGESYPVEKRIFDELYAITTEPYICDAIYSPSMRSKITGDVYPLYKHAKTCVLKDAQYFYAKELDKTVKVFTLHDEEKYQLGNPGDYIICGAYNKHDIRVVKKKDFLNYYELIPN